MYRKKTDSRTISDPFSYFFFFVSELCQPTTYAWEIDVYHLCRNLAGYTHSLTLVNLASSSASCILHLFCMHSKYRFGKNYCIWHPLLTSQLITLQNLSLELLSQSLSVLYLYLDSSSIIRSRNGIRLAYFSRTIPTGRCWVRRIRRTC